MTLQDAQRTMQAIAGFMRAGRHDEARRDTASLAADDASSDEVLAFAGMVAARLGDPALGAQALERLHARRPDDRATRLNLAQAALALGNYPRVIELCAAHGGDVAAMRMCAFSCQQTGALDRARNLYRGLLAAQPDDPDSWANLGNVCLAQADYDAAIDALEHAITLRPDVRFFLNLVSILDAADRSDARMKVAVDAVAVAPRDPAAHRAVGLAAFTIGDMAQAEAALRQAIALAPADAGAWIDLGLMFEGSNRLDDLDALIGEARGHIGAELALLEGWAELRARRFGDAADSADRVPDTIHPIRRAHLRALVADRSGHVDQAFAAYEDMNAAVLSAHPTASDTPSYGDLVRSQNHMFVARPAARSVRPAMPDAPIFVTGFPRSGTTLLNTILSGLSDTVVLEEPPLLSAIEADLGGAIAALDLDDAAANACRADYRRGLDRIVPEASGRRIIDKHPLHMARMPLIDRLFSGAPVILLERHPCDVVLSCFFANFTPSHTMLSFADLSEAARTYDAVWTAWSLAEARLPLNVHRIRYETLVTDPAAELPAALSFIGAEYESGLMDTTTAAARRSGVRTASYAQVTEPMHTGSVNRWHLYRSHLARVMPILSPWIERLGYSSAD